MAETKLKLNQSVGTNIMCPEGYMINGRIVPSVASNNITVSLKTLAGNDPSPADPIIVRIGDTVRIITAATSFTGNAATNWGNCGSAELATKEVDWFVYLEYNTITSSVKLGISRYPAGYLVSDFVSSATSEKGLMHDTGANSTDGVELIGRFAATLSAGAGYTWSVPTFTTLNLIQRPIYETRYLTWAPTLVGWTTPSVNWAKYIIRMSQMFVKTDIANSTSNSTSTTITLPFSVLNYPSGSVVGTNNGSPTGPSKYGGAPASNSLTIYMNYSNTAWTASGNKAISFDSVAIEI